MPIIGLTNDITPRYPRIGKLRKGGEKTATGFGVDLDHFRFASPYPEVNKAFATAYPKPPRELTIIIPHDTVEQTFMTACELWGKSGMVHRCDGMTMTIWLEGSRYVRGAKPCTGGHKDNDPRRDSVGRLEFIIPQLIEKGYVGYVTLETHSIHDILNISRVLSAVYKSQGTLAGVEFVLRRVKENISVPGWGDRKNDRARADKWLVRLEPSVEWVKKQLDSSRRRALAFNEPPPAPILSQRALSAPGESLSPNSDLSDGDHAITEAGTDVVDEIPGRMPAPAAPNGKTNSSGRPAQKPDPKAKTASIRVTMQRWNEFCANFAGHYPHYQNEESKPDKWHIGAAAVLCGFPVVTNENFEQVSAALISRAQEKHPAPI